MAPARGLAGKKGVSPSQPALAWLLRRSPVMLPVPGPANVSHLKDNVAAAIKLTDGEFSKVDAISG